jgi:hypothetical protein
MNRPSSTIRNTLVAIGVAAAVIPAAVSDAKPRTDKPPKAQTVTYVFKGTFDGGAVDVTKGNKHVKRAGLVGTEVAFDFTSARVKVADTNGDGTRNLADVADGDKVVVKARLARKAPGDGPFAARQLVDQTHPKKAGSDESKSKKTKKTKTS